MCQISVKHTWSQLYSSMEIEALDTSSHIRGDDFVEEGPFVGFPMCVRLKEFCFSNRMVIGLI